MKGPLTSLGARTHLWLARVPPPHWQSQRGVSGRSLADMSLEIENTSLEIENTSLEIENTYHSPLAALKGPRSIRAAQVASWIAQIWPEINQYRHTN